MTKEELKQEAEKWLNKWELCNKCENKVDCISNFSYCKKVVLQAYLASAEPREKRIDKLEEKISVLLSCKNCPENKGGLICQKEYEDKCLTQKIQFIKELRKENAELKNRLEHRNCLDCSNHSSKLRMRTLELEKENAELKSDNQRWKDEWQEQVQKATDEGYARTLQTIQLTKVKEIIKKMLYEYQRLCFIKKETIAEAEQFLSEVEK